MKRLLVTLALVAMPLGLGLTLAAPADARAGGHYGEQKSVLPTPTPDPYKSSWEYRHRRRDRHTPVAPDRDFDGRLLATFMGGVVIVLGGIWLFTNRPGRPKAPPETLIEGHRRRGVERLMAEAAALDPVWREEAFIEHAKEAYVAVQRAWVSRDQDIAKDVMTPAFYARQKAETDAMRERGEANALEKLEITAVRPLYIADRQDDSQDEIWVQISARAIDYLVDLRTGRVLKGDKGKLSVFKEVWKFKRDGQTWRVDAIEGDLHPMMLPTSVSEA